MTLTPSHPRGLPLVLILSAFVLAAGCGRGRNGGAITSSGQIEATDVRISTKVGGTLEALPISEGDRVTAGQVLARIDTTDTALLLAQARADQAQAKADLDLRLAGSRPEEISQARAQVDRAQADLDGAQRDFDRMQALLDAGSGTIQSRDDARTRRDLAAASLTAVQEQLRQRQNGSRPQEVEAARAQLQAAGARVAQIAQQIQDATIVSPTDGIVTEKPVESGELLGPGTLICVVSELDSPWLTAYVGEPDLSRIRLGQEADVITDAGAVRKGRIIYISSEAEFTPKDVETREERTKLVFKIKITVDNRDGLFKPGMPAEARIQPAESKP